MELPKLTSVVRRVGGPAVATMTAMIASYANQVVASAAFGMQAGLDAYLATNALCNVALASVGGAFGVALSHRAATRQKAGLPVGAEITTGLVAVGVVAAALVGAAEPLGRLLAPASWAMDHGLVLRLLYINVAGMVLNVCATVASSLLVGRGKTFLGLASPVFVSAGGVIGVALFGRSLGVMAVAVGTLAGAAVRLAVTARTLPRSLLGRAQLAEAGEFWLGHAALLGAGALVMAVTVLDKVALAIFPAGTISRVSYALMLLTSAAAVMSSALGGPLARRYAQMSDSSRWTGAAGATTISIRWLLPVSVFVVVTAGPLAGLLLRWGRVTVTDVATIGQTMRLGGGVVLVTCLTTIATYVIGRGRTRLVLWATAGGIGAAGLVFFGLRRVLGPLAIPLGYSAMYVVVASAYVTRFLREERNAASMVVRQWVAAAAPSLFGALGGAGVLKLEGFLVPTQGDHALYLVESFVGAAAVGGAVLAATWMMRRPVARFVGSSTTARYESGEGPAEPAVVRSQRES